MRVLAISSQKGGSGKTTLAGHIAVEAERVGAGPVALIDTDPQGSLDSGLGSTPRRRWRKKAGNSMNYMKVATLTSSLLANISHPSRMMCGTKSPRMQAIRPAGSRGWRAECRTN